MFYIVRQFGESERIEFHETPPTNYSFRSAGFPTEAELREQYNVLPESCKECGGLIQTNYTEPTMTQLITRNICFSCNFWTKILADPKVIIKRSDGSIHHYTISPETDSNTPKSWKGFGGSKFIIEFFNRMGEPITTTNLWHQGEVPKHFQDRLQPNAQFLS